MQRVTLNILLFSTTLLVPGTVIGNQPAEHSIRKLTSACQQAFSSVGPDRYDEAERSCGGFIDDIWETMGSESSISMELGSGVAKEHSLCVPDLPSHSYLAWILVEWAQRNPEKLREQGPTGLFSAIEELYPCEGPWDQEQKPPEARPSTTARQQIVPDRCPLCGSDRILESVFGYEGPDFDTSRYVSLGCFPFPGSQRWHCRACFHMWGLVDLTPYLELFN